MLWLKLILSVPIPHPPGICRAFFFGKLGMLHAGISKLMQKAHRGLENGFKYPTLGSTQKTCSLEEG